MLQSTYNVSKSVGKYMWSLFYSDDHNTIKTKNINDDNCDLKPRLSWTSYILFFVSPYGDIILDQAYIFIGNVPNYYVGYYINFINWIKINNRTVYTREIPIPKNNNKKHVDNYIEIDPDDIHLHIRVGNTPFDKEYFIDNPTYYLHFFSKPSHLYKSIKNQLTPDKIKIIDISEDFGPIDDKTIRERAESIDDPRFKNYKHQIYGSDMSNIMFTGIIPSQI
jgi:hypothetical protein